MVEEGGAIASLLPYTVVISQIDGTGADALSFAFCYAGNCVEAGPGKDDGCKQVDCSGPYCEDDGSCMSVFRECCACLFTGSGCR